MSRPPLRERVRMLQAAAHNGVEVPDCPRIEKVVRALRRQPAGRLLDVGYSEGSAADFLAGQGWECVGLDLNEHHSPKVRTARCDLNEGFPVESDAFDAVIAGEVIEHMIDEAEFLKECRRVLKKGGLLVLTTPNLAFSLNRILALMGKMPFSSPPPTIIISTSAAPSQGWSKAKGSRWRGSPRAMSSTRDAGTSPGKSLSGSGTFCRRSGPT